MKEFTPEQLVSCDQCGEVMYEHVTLLHKCPAPLLKAIKEAQENTS